MHTFPTSAICNRKTAVGRNKMCYLAPICIYKYIYRNLVTYIDLPFTNLQVPFGISLSFALKLWGQKKLYIFEQQTTANHRATPRDVCFSEREKEYI